MSNEQEKLPDELQNVWCCSMGHNCKWAGFASNKGLAWGTIISESEEWRKWHDQECKGQLIQLLPYQSARERDEAIAAKEATESNIFARLNIGNQ